MTIEKITITPEELAELYRNNKNTVVADKLGVSVPTLIRYINDLKIPLKHKGNRDNSDKIGNGKTKVIFA